MLRRLHISPMNSKISCSWCSDDSSEHTPACFRNNPPMRPPYQPAGFCPTCGYPIDAGRCPECGVYCAEPPETLVNTRRSRGWRIGFLVSGGGALLLMAAILI